jgi:hypothetical protein
MMRFASLLSISAVFMAAASASLITPTIVDLDVVTDHKSGPPFLVEVVANGVPKDGKAYVPDPDQRLQEVGLDLWIGASVAYEDLKDNLKSDGLNGPLRDEYIANFQN